MGFYPILFSKIALLHLSTGERWEQRVIHSHWLGYKWEMCVGVKFLERKNVCQLSHVADMVSAAIFDKAATSESHD